MLLPNIVVFGNLAAFFNIKQLFLCYKHVSLIECSEIIAMIVPVFHNVLGHFPASSCLKWVLLDAHMTGTKEQTWLALFSITQLLQLAFDSSCAAHFGWSIWDCLRQKEMQRKEEGMPYCKSIIAKCGQSISLKSDAPF